MCFLRFTTALNFSFPHRISANTTLHYIKSFIILFVVIGFLVFKSLNKFDELGLKMIGISVGGDSPRTCLKINRTRCSVPGGPNK